MSTTTAAELSLINDTEFLEELAQFDPQNVRTPDPSFDPRPEFEDAFDALEGGLPMDPAAPVNAAPHYGQEPPTANPYSDPPAALQAPIDRQIPLTAAALVILACLTVGAVTAVYVFEDRVAQITATLPASR